MQHRSTTQQHNYAYKRQPSNQVYSSTFNPHLPSGHTSSIKQVQGNPYAPATTFYGSNSATAVEERPPEATSASTSSSPLANFNLASLAKYADPDELKGLVDRFGGLDGILATVTKVQKVMSTVGQMAPMAKVFTGIFGNKRASGQEQTTAQSSTYVPARRKQTVKRSSSVKTKGRKVQVNKRSENRPTKRSQVYSNSQKR